MVNTSLGINSVDTGGGVHQIQRCLDRTHDLAQVALELEFAADQRTNWVQFLLENLLVGVDSAFDDEFGFLSSSPSTI